MKRTKEFKADNLWYIAVESMDSTLNPMEARRTDLTNLFYYELEQRIKNGEIININMNGKVRSGKSTAAMAIVCEIKKLITKYHKIKRPMSNKNILRDQNEYARTVKRRPNDFKHEADVIDEWSEMELTGYNATIEQKYLKQFSDVQAGRYFHRVSCSPGDVTDPNSDIFLSVVPGSRCEGKTLFLLYYRLSTGEITNTVPLGHVKIDVTKVLSAKWYKTYLQKKEEKWELMNQHNVKSPRELEYAEITLNTYTRIKDLAKAGLVKKKFFKPILKEEADKKGIWFSILGDKDVLEDLEGMAELTSTIHEIEKKEKSKGSLKEELEQLKKSLAKSLSWLTTKIELWEQYQRIEE